MGPLLEFLVTIALLSFIGWLVLRAVRPRTTRELAGKPRSFAVRLEPLVEARALALDPQIRSELESELREVFAEALSEHGLGADEYELVLGSDDAGATTAIVYGEGSKWSPGQFDDHLLTTGRV